MIKKIIKIAIVTLLLLTLFFLLLSAGENPEEISYGVSFSKLRSDDLGLDWKEVYLSVLDDLSVRNLRLSAHWPMIEPRKDELNFSELDYQLNEAQERDAEVILAVGRRLPVWPECHVPDWARELSWEDQKEEIFEMIERTVDRYKNYKNIKYWQVENEPFLEIFAKEYCGGLDKKFLKEEIELVKKLDPARSILVTDSGNLGLWYGAWRSGDVFGTSVYIYLWNPELGQIKSILWPSLYKAKKNLMSLLFGRKESVLVELSLEPWLITPALEVSLSTHLERMDINKFDEVIDYAKQTGFKSQYLWGVEWWYWMRGQGHEEFWNKARTIFDRS